MQSPRTAQLPVVVFLLVIAFASVRDASAQLPALRSTVVATGLSAPVAFVPDPIDPTVQFVVEQAGRIRIVRNGVLLAAIF